MAEAWVASEAILLKTAVLAGQKKKKERRVTDVGAWIFKQYSKEKGYKYSVTSGSDAPLLTLLLVQRRVPVIQRNRHIYKAESGHDRRAKWPRDSPRKKIISRSMMSDDGPMSQVRRKYVTHVTNTLRHGSSQTDPSLYWSRDFQKAAQWTRSCHYQCLLSCRPCHPPARLKTSQRPGHKATLPFNLDYCL